MLSCTIALFSHSRAPNIAVALIMTVALGAIEACQYEIREIIEVGRCAVKTTNGFLLYLLSGSFMNFYVINTTVRASLTEYS